MKPNKRIISLCYFILLVSGTGYAGATVTDTSATGDNPSIRRLQQMSVQQQIRQNTLHQQQQQQAQYLQQQNQRQQKQAELNIHQHQP